MSAAPTATVRVRTPGGTRDVPSTLRVPGGLPGLPGHDAYELAALDDSGAVFTLRSARSEDRPVRLFVVAPQAFFPQYAPELPADALASLGLAEGTTPVLLAVVHPADDDRERPTANLLAPLVVHPGDGGTAQVLLDGDHPLRAPLG